MKFSWSRIQVGVDLEEETINDPVTFVRSELDSSGRHLLSQPKWGTLETWKSRLNGESRFRGRLTKTAPLKRNRTGTAPNAQQLV